MICEKTRRAEAIGEHMGLGGVDPLDHLNPLAAVPPSPTKHIWARNCNRKNVLDANLHFHFWTPPPAPPPGVPPCPPIETPGIYEFSLFFKIHKCHQLSCLRICIFERAKVVIKVIDGIKVLGHRNHIILLSLLCEIGGIH